MALAAAHANQLACDNWTAEDAPLMPTASVALAATQHWMRILATTHDLLHAAAEWSHRQHLRTAAHALQARTV